jgi:hypothetical protein
MNISDYLTNHLNLSQAQIEAIGKLAKICGMKSLFEAFNFASRVNKVNANRTNNINNQAADSLVTDVDWNLDNGSQFNELYKKRRGAAGQEDDVDEDTTAELGEHSLNDDNTLFYGLTGMRDLDSEDETGEYDLGGISNVDLNDAKKNMSASVDVNEREDLMDVIKLLSLAAKSSIADTKKLMIAAAASLDDDSDSTAGSEYDAGLDSVVSANDVSEKVRDLAAQAVEKQDFRLQAKMEEFASKYPKNPFSKIFLADNVRASHRSDAAGTDSGAVTKEREAYNKDSWNRVKALADAALARVNARKAAARKRYAADDARVNQMIADINARKAAARKRDVADEARVNQMIADMERNA